MLVVSCSFTRKVENAYELAANTNPITSKDTLNAIKIAKKFTRAVLYMWKTVFN